MSKVAALQAYKESTGSLPSELVSSGYSLNSRDLETILAFREIASSNSSSSRETPKGIWPLVSHHTYGSRALFGVNPSQLLPRTLALLLLHDGLVVADPLEAVRRTYLMRPTFEAVAALNRATAELSRVEPLLECGAMRLTPLRPTLSEEARIAVLTAMGLGEDLRVFTDFLEAACVLSEFPGLLHREYAPQVCELYRMFGLLVREPETEEKAVLLVKNLAAAVLEVSWQLAVAALDPWCDLAPRGKLERHLLTALIDQGLIEKNEFHTRHFSTLEAGRVPNLDSERLTVADAIAIRRGDEFASFRLEVSQALSAKEASEGQGKHLREAEWEFEERMKRKAIQMQKVVKRSSFLRQLTGNSVTLSLGSLTAFLSGSAVMSAGAGALGLAGATLADVIYQWALGRRPGARVAHRYYSMLGNV